MTASVDPAGLEEELAALTLTGLTNDDAIALGTLAVATARREGLAVTVDVRRGAHQLFHAALPGTSADNDAWIDRKARVADRFGRASLLVHHDLQGRAAGLDPALHAAVGGSVPLVVRGVGPVGTLTVSGLPHEADHDLAVRVLRAFLLLDGAGSA